MSALAKKLRWKSGQKALVVKKPKDVVLEPPEGAKEPPRSQGARRFAGHTTPLRWGKSLVRHHGRLAGALGSGLAGRLP